MMSKRNYNDPSYVKWRKAVYARDGYCCQWPSCGSKKRLNAHHIRMWAKYPHLRFTVSNGITLCKYHHDSIWGKEEDYVMFCFELLLRGPQSAKLSSRPRRKNGNARKRKSTRADYAARYARAISKSKRRK